MQVVFTERAPGPAGHYSQAIVHQGLVYVSGQLPINPQTGEKVSGSIEDQTVQALTNLSQVLNAAGSDISQALKVTAYISDMDRWDRVNKIYAQFFGDHKPARWVVPTRELHFGFNIEINAIAAVSQGKG